MPTIPTIPTNVSQLQLQLQQPQISNERIDFLVEMESKNENL